MVSKTAEQLDPLAAEEQGDEEGMEEGGEGEWNDEEDLVAPEPKRSSKAASAKSKAPTTAKAKKQSAK